MKRTLYIVAAIALLAMASCKQEDYYLFKDVARLQFGPTPNFIYIKTHNLDDTTKNFTFYYNTVTSTQDTVFFDIYAEGGPTTTDRSFALQQVQVAGATNAVAGTDYKAFTDPAVTLAYVIKAGQVHANVPVVLLRSAALKTTTLTLKFMVVENSNFKQGEETNLWRKIIYTDRLSQPTAWNASAAQTYYGAYSTVKHAFMIQVTGLRWDEDLITSLSSDYMQRVSLLIKIKAALIDYNNAHPGNPMKDETGVVIVFP
jgi:hypothetical protein